ncbi:MAG: DUF4397 domain-containing protein [Ignavibacteriales bacterium]|nr:DUF4397 domain-containing protein [Ignavibacteriales bacterium]
MLTVLWQFPDFAFRTATPFIDLPAGVTLNIGVAPGNSYSKRYIKNFPVVLTAGEKYVVFANGVLTGGYAPNPDSRNTDFTLFVKPMAQEVGTGSGVDLFVLHGSTDAPTVDVKVRELSSAIMLIMRLMVISPLFNCACTKYNIGFISWQRS